MKLRKHIAFIIKAKDYSGWLKALTLCLSLFHGGILFASDTVVVVFFVVDGLQPDALETATKNGAKNFKFLIENGVWVEEARCTSPAARLELPDGSLPWGTTSPPNISMHTGTHIFETRCIDDIFLSARDESIKSVFAGGTRNYEVFNTADFTYASGMSDEKIVQHGINHFLEDDSRLIRLHLQKLRGEWSGPEDKTRPGSAYQDHIMLVDSLLGNFIQVLKDEGVWENTYIITASDHGMGMTEKSNHPPSVYSSWQVFTIFYGPGIKKGRTIPYAETPDLAIMVNHFLNLQPLEGHKYIFQKEIPSSTTGTFLSNIFLGNPEEIEHPRYIQRYLEDNNLSPSDEFQDYREAMLLYFKNK